MKINKDKHIGRVLFIVEGSKTEFAILYRIFCKLLGYSYIEKRRNCPTYFVSNHDRFSQVAVINTRESNIKDISENETYLDDLSAKPNYSLQGKNDYRLARDKNA